MNVDARLLVLFLEKQGQFISGTAIGETLGISRVSVHNHLEQLKKEGFQFSAIRNKGYRLEDEPVAFHPALFAALLEREPCPFFKHFIAKDKVDSTNSVAEAGLAAGDDAPFLVIADSQSAGRGRRGRNWHSPEGKNLYISMALRPAMPPARLQTITLWLGLQICQLLRDRYALPVMIKWPNDLMVHGDKIAGMLTEARVDAEQTRDLVFGLGLNVNSQANDFPPELQDMAASLAMHAGRPIRATRLAHAIVHRLAGAVDAYLEDRYTDDLTGNWASVDYLRGREVRTGTLTGTVIGIASNGSLRLQKPDGSSVLIHSGEVTLGSGNF